jgi:solute carrier family 25 (mitochondrial citrate transporter), member 1
MHVLQKGLTPFATHLTLKYALPLDSNIMLQSAFKDPMTEKVSVHGRLAFGILHVSLLLIDGRIGNRPPTL